MRKFVGSLSATACKTPSRPLCYQVAAAALHRLRNPGNRVLAIYVSLAGVESSGTTTLASSLAEHYQTAWVPEYGRFYWEGRRHISETTSFQKRKCEVDAGGDHGSCWTVDEFARIGAGQSELEDRLAHLAVNGLLICDTDALATTVWLRRYCGAESRCAALEEPIMKNIKMVCPLFRELMNYTKN